MHPETHPVVGVGSVVGEVAHGCVFRMSRGVQPFGRSCGHVVEDEPETCFLEVHTQYREREQSDNLIFFRRKCGQQNDGKENYNNKKEKHQYFSCPAERMWN